MNREPGFYWVRLKGNDPHTGKPFEWEPAQWISTDYHGPCWIITGTEDDYFDREFAEIDERQIKRLTD